MNYQAIYTKINRILQYITVIVMVCGSVPTYAIAEQQHSVTLSQIAAVVDNQIITNNQLSAAINVKQRTLSLEQRAIPPFAQLRHAVLDELINNHLELALAQNTKIAVSDNEVTELITNIARNNSMTTAELYKKIHNLGLSTDDYRTQLKNTMVINRLRQIELFNSIGVTASAITELQNSYRNNPKYYEYHLIDFIIDDKAIVQHQLPEIIKQLQISAHKSAKRTPYIVLKRDLGWRSITEIPDIFTTAVHQMHIGSYSKPIHANNGYHIIYMQNKRHTVMRTLSASEARNILLERRSQAKLQQWLVSLRKHSFVNIHPNNLT